MHDFNPSQIFDEKGRLKRWVKDPIEYQPMIKSCCREKRHPTDLQHDLAYVDKLELFNSRLYDDIDFRTRAMKNWQKLRILIVLFQICGKNTIDDGKKKV